MEVEVIHPLVGVVSTPTMIMMSLHRNIALGMSTTNNATPLLHHGTTVTMVAALADAALHVTPQRSPGPPVLPGHTLKNKVPTVMAETPHLHKEEVVKSHVLPMQAPGTQANSPVN